MVENFFSYKGNFQKEKKKCFSNNYKNKDFILLSFIDFSCRWGVRRWQKFWGEEFVWCQRIIWLLKRRFIFSQVFEVLGIEVKIGVGLVVDVLQCKVLERGQNGSGFEQCDEDFINCLYFYF